MVSYEEDIQEAIGIILNTYLGERVMRESFGTNIADYIFDPINRLTVQNLGGNIAELLQLQEPRIEDVSVDMLDTSDPYSGSIAFSISYTVRTTNNRYNHVYPFYMDEGNREETVI